MTLDTFEGAFFFTFVRVSLDLPPKKKGCETLSKDHIHTIQNTPKQSRSSHSERNLTFITFDLMKKMDAVEWYS
jgi:hypothetical protein